MDYFFYNTDTGSLTSGPRPRYRILLDSSFAAVSGDRQAYGEQLDQLTPGDILMMYENGVGVVALGRVLEKWDGVAHETPLYYKVDEVGVPGDGRHEYRIGVDWLDLSDAPIGVSMLRDKLGYTPRGAVTRIVKQRDEVARLFDDARAVRLMPDEVASPTSFIEGAAVSVHVNAYERSREAVEHCKKIKGTACVICDFDFGKVYGAEFIGFIHVHHLSPLHEIGKQYTVSPETDLVPVCPNCHAVLHHGGRLRTPGEVQQLLRPK